MREIQRENSSLTLRFECGDAGLPPDATEPLVKPKENGRERNGESTRSRSARTDQVGDGVREQFGRARLVRRQRHRERHGDV